MNDIERFLFEYRGVQNRICDLELKLKEIQAKKDAQYDKMLKIRKLKPERIRGGPEVDPVVEAVAKLVDVYAEREKKIAGDLSAANGKLHFIEDTVEAAGLCEEELRYVRLRYFEGLKAWKVAQEIGYSDSRARDYKKGALAKIGTAWYNLGQKEGTAV